MQQLEQQIATERRARLEANSQIRLIACDADQKADSQAKHLTNQSLKPNPVMDAYKRDVDRTLIQANLKLSVEERLEKLMKLQQFANEFKKAGKQAKT